MNEAVGDIKHRSPDGLWHATETCYDLESDATQPAQVSHGKIVLRRTLCGIPLTLLDATQPNGAFSVGHVQRSLEAITCLVCMSRT